MQTKDKSQTTLRLPPEILQKAKQIALKEKRSLNDVFEELLRKYIEENENGYEK